MNNLQENLNLLIQNILDIKNTLSLYTQDMNLISLDKYDDKIIEIIESYRKNNTSLSIKLIDEIIDVSDNYNNYNIECDTSQYDYNTINNVNIVNQEYIPNNVYLISDINTISDISINESWDTSQYDYNNIDTIENYSILPNIIQEVFYYDTITEISMEVE